MGKEFSKVGVVNDLEQAAEEKRERLAAEEREKRRRENLLKSYAVECVDKDMFSSLDYALLAYTPLVWRTPIRELPKSDYNLVEIYSQEVFDLFQVATLKMLKIQTIERVENPWLWLLYQSKKADLKRLYGKVTEMQLFHGTKTENLHSICSNNFNWRKFGSNRGNKFGQGVSFAGLASYASNFTEKFSNRENKIILARVLVAAACPGDENMVLPGAAFNASKKPDGGVYVLYDDNCFYPEFIITYVGVLPPTKGPNPSKSHQIAKQKGKRR